MLSTNSAQQKTSQSPSSTPSSASDRSSHSPLSSSAPTSPPSTEASSEGVETATSTPDATGGAEAEAGNINDSEKDADADKPGAIGGFMRGLIGGQSVAVEDAFVAEAKQQGVEIPQPPPQHHATLVPVKRRKRRDDGDGEDGSGQSIRDRIFGRFAGSAFMKNATEAKERIKETIDESNNPIVNIARNLYDRLFAENEMGMVIREIREEDPNFQISDFLQHVEHDLAPTILNAYLHGRRDDLSSKCTPEAYSMLNASIRERDAEGIVMDTNILHISDVELTAARLLEDSPVLIVTFSTQQINCLRDRAGNIVEGKEDDIRAVYYAWAFVREAEFEDVGPSGGGMGASEERSATGDGAQDGAADGADAEDSKKDENEDESTPKVKPWKLMEMVIRGAHSTI